MKPIQPSRRGFLAALLAAAAAPAIVRADSLMKIWVPSQQVFTYEMPIDWFALDQVVGISRIWIEGNIVWQSLDPEIINVADPDGDYWRCDTKMFEARRKA